MRATNLPGQGIPASSVDRLLSRMDREDMRVDIPAPTESGYAIRRRHLDSRVPRADLAEFSACTPVASAPLPSRLIASCLRFDSTAPTLNRQPLELFLQQEAEALVEQLRNEHESHREHQGRMLRYTLIMLQHRVQTLRADLDREEDASHQTTDHRACCSVLSNKSIPASHDRALAGRPSGPAALQPGPDRRLRCGSMSPGGQGKSGPDPAPG